MLAALLETQPRDKLTILLGFFEWQKEALLSAWAPHHANPETRGRGPCMCGMPPPHHANPLTRGDVGEPVTAEVVAAAAEVERAEEAAAAAPMEVTSEMSAVERAGLYHRGGRLFITTRILVVDLLASRVRPPPPAYCQDPSPPCV